jgi:hypothetical protein
MPANTSPLFTITPNCTTKAIAASAETSRTAPTNVNKVLTGGTNGTLVESLNFIATGTTTAGMLRIFHRIADAGTYFLIGEVPVSAVTPSGTVACWTGTWVPPANQSSPPGQWILPATDCLYVTTHNAEAFDCTPSAGDF